METAEKLDIFSTCPRRVKGLREDRLASRVARTSESTAKMPVGRVRLEA